MATSNGEGLECAICNENLEDPRALPCGHSYCGPPRLCLSAMEKREGYLQCAVCRVDHKLKPEDIKPLYGIRDYLQGSAKKKTGRTVFVPCSIHKSRQCTLWCNTCNGMACLECFDDEHEDHSMRNLKKHLVKKLEERFGKSLEEGIKKCQEDLRGIYESKSFELEKLKLRVAEMERDMANVQTQIEFLDNCSEVSNSASDDTGYETYLLLGVYKLDMNPSEAFDNAIRNTKSSQTDVSGFPFKAEAVRSTVQSQSTFALREKNKASSVCSSVQMPPGKCSNINPQLREADVDLISDCECLLEHSPTPPLNFPFSLLTRFHIDKCAEYVIGTADSLIICPFQFWITADVDGLLYKSSQNVKKGCFLKMVRFTVNCCHVENGVGIESLPPSTFHYGFTLNNSNAKLNKTRKGTWIFPRDKQVLWYSMVPFSELINSENGWIQGDTCLELILELKL